MKKTIDVFVFYIECAENIADAQNYLNHLGATETIISLLSEDAEFRDKSVELKLLDFGIKLLEGGNKNVQITAFNQFKNDSSSSFFFRRIFRMMTNNKEQLEIIEDIAFDDNLVLNESFIMLGKVLRLVQLLVEGHNLNLQQYLRYQENSAQSFDILHCCIELFICNVKIFTDSNYIYVVKLLDTIIELIQGPCRENQVETSNSGILEHLNYILDSKRDDEIILDVCQSVQVDNEKEHISSLYGVTSTMLIVVRYKVMILMNGLIEMNASKIIKKNILRNVQRAHIEKIIRRSYSEFLSLTKGNYSAITELMKKDKLVKI